MTKNAERVVAGFARLTNPERADVVKDLNRIIEAGEDTKRELCENFSKRAGVDIGPLGSGGCPCCGKA